MERSALIPFNFTIERWIRSIESQKHPLQINLLAKFPILQISGLIEVSPSITQFNSRQCIFLDLNINKIIAVLFLI
jgi:hypothetical protein